MSIAPNLVIISSEQFGHHIDTYYYCRYLQPEFSVTYICWDHGLPRLALDNVNIVYVSRDGGLARIGRFVRVVDQIAAGLDSKSPAVFFINYMKGMSSLIRLRHWRQKFVLDIRTGDVSPNQWIRLVKNTLLKVEYSLFNNVSVISESLAARLGLSDRAYILPLGADEIAPGNRSFDVLRVLYVGTLYNRNLATAVKGFASFLKHSGVGGLLTIVGGSPGSEKSELNALIRDLHLVGRVTVVGAVPHDQLAPYFAQHNIGLSYIPITPYYDVQPPTKTFEYLMSGMAVLGTATLENKKVISAENGVISDDTADGVCAGLQALASDLGRFSSDEIRNSVGQHRWPIIIENLRHHLIEIAAGIKAPEQTS